MFLAASWKWEFECIIAIVRSVFDWNLGMHSICPKLMGTKAECQSYQCWFRNLVWIIRYNNQSKRISSLVLCATSEILKRINNYWSVCQKEDRYTCFSLGPVPGKWSFESAKINLFLHCHSRHGVFVSLQEFNFCLQFSLCLLSFSPKLWYSPAAPKRLLKTERHKHIIWMDGLYEKNGWWVGEPMLSPFNG